MTERETIADAGLKVRYYRSFISYEIPFQPEGEIPFAETEGLRSFYVGYCRGQSRADPFVKLLLVRGVVREIVLPECEEPGTTIYFQVERQPEARRARVGLRVEYVDTETMTKIFEGQVGASGRDCQATLFRKEQVFKDVYFFWPNGQLKTRILSRSECHKSIWQFDEAGNPREGEDVAGQALDPAVPGQPPENLRLLVSGKDAGGLARELKSKVDAEQIPGLSTRQADTTIVAAITGTVGESLGIIVPSVAESLSQWLTTRHDTELKIVLDFGGRKATLSPGHFDRKKLAALLSDGLHHGADEPDGADQRAAL